MRSKNQKKAIDVNFVKVNEKLWLRYIFMEYVSTYVSQIKLIL